MCELDYAGCAAPVTGLGPGNRLVMWVRRCDKRCAGCLSPELWASGTPRPVAEVASELLAEAHTCDGLTISGGEPFDQAASLAQLIDILRHDVDIEVLVYSGYRYEELRTRPDCAALLERIDLLIDGPYREAEANTLQWRGSDNQRVWLLSPRAQRYRDEIDQPMPAQRPLHIQPLGPGMFRIIGIPRRGDYEAYTAALAARGTLLQRNPTE